MKPLRSVEFKAERGENYGTPKEIWDFRTPPSTKAPLSISRGFLAANSALFGIAEDLSGLAFTRAIQSLGANHMIFQQMRDGRRVHRAYVTVHLSRAGQVYLAKNRAAPDDLFPRKTAFQLTKSQAIQKARSGLPKKTRGSTVLNTEEMWFFNKGKMHASWRVRLKRTKPREEWIVYVNAKTGGILSRYDNLSARTGKGSVFDPSPVTALGGHSLLITENGRERRPPREAYVRVSLRGLGNSGYLTGDHVTTAGTPGRRRIRKQPGTFLLKSHDRGFEEVMVYYHIDTALRYLKQLGFKGARAIFRDPVRVNVNGTSEDNSWYSPWEKVLTFGTGDIDDAEDGETILHELGHAIQDMICPDFGQSEEAAAMGEGFGDYFAASFFADRKPEDYRTSVMTWDGLFIGLDEGKWPPCLRHVDEDWTYQDFIPGDDEHDNGEIWSATLWDIREALGGENADRVIIESHFQQDGFTNFARGARAIVDADRNLNRGRNERKLKSIFRRRRISM
jgi:hypothetical protein